SRYYLYIQAYTNNHDKNIRYSSISLSLYQFNHFAFARFNRSYEQEQSTALLHKHLKVKVLD
ncbi:MAG: hypothetical protein RSE18_02855, partial [Acinetobacter sp.]